MHPTVKDLVFCLAVAFVLLAVPSLASAQTGVTSYAGALPDGPTYLIELPPNWIGTLFLYSPGYVPPLPVSLNPRQDVGDPATRVLLLSNELVQPAFVDFKPGPYLRPFDIGSEQCENGRRCSD